MPAPIVSWYDSTNTTQQTSWNAGTVDAGSVGADTEFLIWNNRGGTTAVSDMTSCTITTKDTSGGNTGDVVTGLWVYVLSVKDNETTYTAIGGTTTHAISNGVTAGTISGAANNGTTANSNANYADVKLHLAPPSTAVAGVRQWLTRVSYQYV